jgi:hypothetical protein
MALAQLVAAVIDNLTLTDWGSHKNNVRYWQILLQKSATPSKCATIELIHVSGPSNRG